MSSGAAAGPLVGVSEEDSVDLLFHGQAFNLAATVVDPSTAPPGSTASAYAGTEPMLAIDLEELSTGSLWHAEYSASYIESITSKTGSFKRFPVLVKMLLTAMRHQTDSVALDLLTYSDLELLKSRKMGQPAPSSSLAGGSKGGSGGGGGNNKRYLILTYVVEFDRVHYPLPLQPLEAPTVASLQRQIRRLRSEVANFRMLSGLQPNNTAALAPSGLPTASQALLVSSVSGMQKELVMLRDRLQDVTQSERSLSDALRDANTRLKAATEAAAAGDAALEKLRAASRAEVKRLRGEVADLRERVMVAEASAASAAQQQQQQSSSSSSSSSAGAGGADGQPRKEGEVLAILRETNEVS